MYFNPYLNITSGGSIFFTKLVPGGPVLGGSIFVVAGSMGLVSPLT